MKKVHANDGFVVSFEIKNEILVWFRDALSDENHQVWEKINKYQLCDFQLYQKIDTDCYQYWSLPQLHAQIYPGEDTRRISAGDDVSVYLLLVAEVCCWLANHEDKKMMSSFIWDGVLGKFSSLYGSCNCNTTPCNCNTTEQRAAWLRRGNHWDTLVSVDREPPSNIKYMVVDVETHDWDEGNRDNFFSRRVVEIAWVLCDDEGNQLESKQYLVKPYGYTEIAPKAIKYHGITTKCANELGSDASLVFKEFASILRHIPEDGFVIAHNMKHENSVFQCNLGKEHQAVWDSTPKCDTLSKLLLKYTKYKGQQRRWGVELSELYRSIASTHKSYVAHSANDDVQMTWEIFQYYQQRASHEELKWKQ